jgi:hypothetical protein
MVFNVPDYAAVTVDAGVSTEATPVEVTMMEPNARRRLFTEAKHTRNAPETAVRGSTTNCGVQQLQTSTKTRNGATVAAEFANVTMATPENLAT